MMYGTLCPAGGLIDFSKWSKGARSVLPVLYLVALIHLFGVGVGALSDDGAHLLSFKKGITDDLCEVLSDWNESDSYPCGWSGVRCDPVSLRVLELRVVGKGVVSLNGVDEVGVGDRVPCGLRGTLSPAIGKLSELQVLCLTFNWLSGELPKSIGDLRDLRTLDLQSNLLTGRLPSELGKLSGLEVLNLEYNRFHGHIPAEVSSCQGLRSLSLAGNLLSGSIPPSFGNLPLLESLSLSNNNLIGSIPNELTRSNCMLRRLKFSGNFLTANLPSRAGDYTRLTSPRRLLLPGDGGDTGSPSDGNSGGGHTDVKPVLVAAITAGCAIALVLVSLGIIFQCSKHRHTRVPQAPPTPTGRKVVITFMNSNYNLTYDNVVRATGNFCIDNLIGSGGFGATYKAEVKPGLLVAVKRLAIGRFQGVQQFDTEIRTLGRIRHPNLVTLIGYHASEEEMFLIYNYFSHGNLETVIHFQKEEMNWKTRHSIALRIAEALAYLHDECIPRVLHRDIKPSNILLDENMNAHLSDFGLARLLGASETHATTDVAGTFGYVAPEYAMTCRVTDKADVYSYGVVLLELLTGKRALDPSFCEYGDGFNIVSWACLLIRQGQASQVFTVRLWESGPEKHLLETLKLAVLCTVDQLATRPTMREVVDTLLKIRPL